MSSLKFKKCEKKCNLQEEFLDSLKQKLDNEVGVDVCLWQLSYSYMKLIICYTNKQLIDQTKILNFFKNQMESEVFQELMKHKLKKKKKFNI